MNKHQVRAMGICPYCKRNMSVGAKVLYGLRTCGRIVCEQEADRDEIYHNEQRIQEAEERRDSNVQ